MRVVGDEVEATLLVNGQELVERADRCLVAAGRVPRTHGLGLDALGPTRRSRSMERGSAARRGSTPWATSRPRELAQCIHPHPAVPEGLQECARLLLGESILKPRVFGPELLAVREHLG